MPLLLDIALMELLPVTDFLKDARRSPCPVTVRCKYSTKSVKFNGISTSASRCTLEEVLGVCTQSVKTQTSF